MCVMMRLGLAEEGRGRIGAEQRIIWGGRGAG